MRRWPDPRTSHLSRRTLLERGAAIVNARGIPGTLGFLARTRHDDAPVLVSSHHVLFGDGAREGDSVYLVDARSHASIVIGRLAYGRAGVVRLGDADVWVDAAVARLDQDLLDRAGFDLVDDVTADPDAMLTGATVTKHGAATGATLGRILDVDYLDPSPAPPPRARPSAPAQLLVRSTAHYRPFAAAGDSGAALCDANGAILGLLWGITPRGHGVACPIDALLHVLHIRVARLVPPPRAVTIAATMRDR